LNNSSKILDRSNKENSENNIEYNDYAATDESDESEIVKNIWYEVLNTDPEVRLYHNLLYEGEAEHLIKLGYSRMEQSKIFIENGNVIYDEKRTSSTGSFDHDEDEVLFRLENRVSRLLNTTKEQLEHFQLLKYEQGQKFSPHVDWFNEEKMKRESIRQRYIIKIKYKIIVNILYYYT